MEALNAGIPNPGHESFGVTMQLTHVLDGLVRPRRGTDRRDRRVRRAHLHLAQPVRVTKRTALPEAETTAGGW
jgi:hypothetical protein